MKLYRQHVPFTQVANEVLYRTDISMKAKCMFAYLFSKPEGWDFAGDRIVREMKDGRKAVFSALKELELVGLLKRVRQPSGKVEYSIEYAESPMTQKGNGLFDPIAPFGQEPKRSMTKRGSISNTNSSSNTDKESNTDFEVFWEKYPRHENKKKAKAKWDKLPETVRAKILEDIPRRMKSEQWMRNFIPHPTTYLNGERWEDEIKEVQTAKSY